MSDHCNPALFLMWLFLLPFTCQTAVKINIVYLQLSNNPLVQEEQRFIVGSDNRTLQVKITIVIGLKRFSLVPVLHQISSRFPVAALSTSMVPYDWMPLQSFL